MKLSVRMKLTAAFVMVQIFMLILGGWAQLF